MITLLRLLLLITVNVGYSQFIYNVQWSTYYGGKTTEPLGIAKAVNGDIYMAGIVNGNSPYSDSFATNNSFRNFYGGGLTDGFISKHSPEGALLWSTYFGGLTNSGAIMT